MKKNKTEVTLKKDHTHAGKKYKAGDKVTVCALDAAWLKANGVI